MNWKIARSLAKILNLCFLVLVFVIMLKIYKYETKEGYFSLTKNNELKSVFYYNNSKIIYLKTKIVNKEYLQNQYKKDKLHGIHQDSYNIFQEIINHRLSLVYLFSIFCEDLVKIILKFGII